MATPPIAVNEPVLSFAPGTAERAELKATLAEMSASSIELPLYIGADAVTTSARVTVRAPHRHSLELGGCSSASEAEVGRAIAAAKEAKASWADASLAARASVFLRAAELLAGPWRQRVNAATMLGQSKTAHQAEIDAACELIDFFRFNVAYAYQMAAEQPLSGPGMWNRVEQRPLDGFVYAVTPFNFTSIAANLCTAPALMGNTVIWKPSPKAAYSAHVLMELFCAAGLPDGVINLVYGDAAKITDQVLADPDFAGLHYTGSTAVFRALWRRIGDGLESYVSYPRVVGETGGKDFVFAHASADIDALATAIVRGGYEYQGQKCSAVSRVYVPRSIWATLREQLRADIGQIRVGDPADFRNFMGAVIDRGAFDKIGRYLEIAREDPSCTVLAGGNGSDEEGFFVEPTLVECDDAKHRLMAEEIFGPVVAVSVYDDDRFEEVLSVCDATSPYALTGAIFARDRAAVETANRRLRYAAGNFYINDKPTGAVVGQQPFGGGRASGTNDKAGSALNLWRWVSQRTVKETFVPPTDFRYGFMAEE